MMDYYDSCCCCVVVLSLKSKQRGLPDNVTLLLKREVNYMYTDFFYCMTHGVHYQTIS